MKRKILFLFILLGSFSIVHSQNTSDSANSNVRGIIKINPLQALVGEVRIAYEQPILHNISLEFGAGYMYGIFPGQLDYNGIERGSFNSISYAYPGISLREGLRFYFPTKDKKENYYFLPLIFGKYNQTYVEKIYTFGFQTLVGNNFFLSKKLSLDTYCGVGYRKIIDIYHSEGTYLGNYFNYSRTGIHYAFTPQLGFELGFKLGK